MESNNAVFKLLQVHIEKGHDNVEAIRYRNGVLTYGQLEKKVCTYASYFNSIGIKKGDAAAIYLEDCPDWVFVFLGLLHIGAIAVPIDIFGSVEKIKVCIELSCARFIFTTAHLSNEKDIDFEALDVELLEKVIFIESLGLLPPDSQIAACDVKETDPALILFTSGSTGLPKGVVHSHKSLTAIAEGFGAESLSPCVGDVFFSTSRLFFGYGLGNSIIFPLYFACSVVLIAERMGVGELKQLINEYKVTHFFSVPKIYSSMLMEPEGLNMLPSIKQFISAGEPLPATLAKLWVAATGKNMMDGIGSTEAMHIFCYSQFFPNGTSLIGKRVGNYDIKLFDDNKIEIVTAEQPGSIAVRGEAIASAYCAQPGVNTEMLIDGYLYTGDLYKYSANNELIYLGRNSDIFKSSGLWVSTFEIESTVRELPWVEDVGVVFYLDHLMCQKVMALVIPKIKRIKLIASGVFDDTDCEEAISNHLAAKLPKYKLPNDVRLVSDMPRNSNGKLDKARIKKLLSSTTVDEWGGVLPRIVLTRVPDAVAEV